MAGDNQEATVAEGETLNAVAGSGVAEAKASHPQQEMMTQRS